MLIGIMTVCSLAADAETADRHLIVHYDFEGDSLEQQLSDKAVSGASAENLILNGSGNNFVENGIMTLDGNGENYLRSGANGHADFQGKAGYTVYVVFRTNGSNSGWTNLFWLSYLSRCYFSSDTQMNIRNGSCKKNDFQLIYPGEWATLAVTVDLESKTSNGDLIGTDGKASGTFAVDTGGSPESDLLIRIGKNGNTDRSLTLEIDDFRIYDTVLTEQELSAINPHPAEEPEVILRGWQTSSELRADGTYAVRFIGQVNSLNFEGVGLEIYSAAKDRIWETQNPRLVYNSVTGADSDGNLIRVGAPVGSYFTAYSIQSIPESTADTFVVKPFVIRNGEKVYGSEERFSFQNYSDWNAVPREEGRT